MHGPHWSLVNGIIPGETANHDLVLHKLLTPSIAASETPVSTIEAAFAEYTERSDIAILLINQHVGLPAGPPPPLGCSSHAEIHLYRSQTRSDPQSRNTTKPSRHYSRSPARTTLTVSLFPVPHLRAYS